MSAAFANDMKFSSDHEAVNKQALDLVKKLKVTPEDNDTSRALAKAAAAEKGKLSNLAVVHLTKLMSKTRSPTTNR